MEISLNKINYRNFKNFNIKFKEGLINGVVGSMGSGKSNLVNILSTLSKPNSGHLVIDGIDIDLNNPLINYEMIRFDIGFVLQNPIDQLFCNTVEEQIKYYLSLYNYRNTKKRIVDSLDMVSLSESYLKREISTLSDGELFKVSLASVLAINPKIIILDEPLTFLDNKSKKDLIKLLRIIKNRYHKTIIIFTSDTNFLLEICDYLFVLSKNKIIHEGNKYEVFKYKEKLIKTNIKIPDVIEFEYKVEESKNIKMGYRDCVNDLIKDIYFYKD